MKAIVYEKYGPPEVLEIKEVEKPIPGDNEVLVKVYAASIAFGDVAMIKGEPFIARLWSGLLKPKNTIPGSDMAGKIESVGKNIKHLQPELSLLQCIFSGQRLPDKIGEVYRHCRAYL